MILLKDFLLIITRITMQSNKNILYILYIFNVLIIITFFSCYSEKDNNNHIKEGDIKDKRNNDSNSSILNYENYFEEKLKSKYRAKFLKSFKIAKKSIDIEKKLESFILKDSIKIFSFQNTYYYFYFSNNSIGKKLETQKRNGRILDNQELEYYSYILIIIDKKKNEISMIDSNVIKEFQHILFETKNYLFFSLHKQGSEAIWQEPFEDYISGILLFNKVNPAVFSSFEFPLESIIKIEQIDSKLSVITSKVKPQLKQLKEIGKKISVHTSIGEFKSTGQYYEYLYDLNLKQISRKEIYKPDDL